MISEYFNVIINQCRIQLNGVKILAFNTFSESDRVTLNACFIIQWQYILLIEQRTNDWEDTHAIAYPNLIYKNNQIRKMKHTPTVHKYTFNNLQTQNVYQHGAHSFICSISMFLNHEPYTIYRGVIIGHFGNTLFQSKAASVM